MSGLADFNEGIKEEDGKLFYEIDWEFVEAMAKNMAANKGSKYSVFNWKKEIDIEKLKQALTSHFIEVQKGNYTDKIDLDHWLSISCNCMMIWHQLNKKD